MKKMAGGRGGSLDQGGAAGSAALALERPAKRAGDTLSFLEFPAGRATLSK